MMKTHKEDDHMKRKLLITGLVVLAALALSVPAFASSRPAPAKSFTVNGTVVLSNLGTTNTLTVHVRLASWGAKQFIGKNLTMDVASHVKILQGHGHWLTSISLADLSAGDRVSVGGSITQGASGPVFTANRIVAPTVQPWQHLKHFAVRGSVVSVAADGSSLVIHLNAASRSLAHSLRGDVTCQVSPQAKLWSMVNGVKTATTMTAVAPGDKVVAFGTVNRTHPKAPVFTIMWMMVTPAPAS
jgi:type 1 fimbria pilin